MLKYLAVKIFSFRFWIYNTKLSFTFYAKSEMVVSKPQIGRNSVAATSCSSAVLWPTRGLMASAETASDLVVAWHGHSGQWEWSADRSLRLVSHQPRIAWRKPKAFTFDAAADRRPRCSTAQRAWAMSSPTTRKHSLHPSKIHCFLYSSTTLFLTCQ